MKKTDREYKNEYDKKHLEMIGIKDQKVLVQFIKKYVDNTKKNNVIYDSYSKYCLLSTLYCIENNIDLSIIDTKKYFKNKSINEKNEAEK